MTRKRQKIGKDRRQRLIRDLVAAQHDLITLADQHRLGADDLAQWIADPENQFTLAGLCQLADLQTQVLLSRYRLLAAGQLVKLATQTSPDQPAAANDVARKACVDLLKLDLKRAELDDAMTAPPQADPIEDLIPLWLTTPPDAPPDHPPDDPPDPPGSSSTAASPAWPSPEAMPHDTENRDPCQQKTPGSPPGSPPGLSPGLPGPSESPKPTNSSPPDPLGRPDSYPMIDSTNTDPLHDQNRTRRSTCVPQDVAALRNWLYGSITPRQCK